VTASISRSIITAKAPSNIALVKYMGKVSVEGNLPANGSLSMTLDSLCTLARVRRGRAGLQWNADLFSGHEKVGSFPAIVPALSENGRQRILRHAQRVLEEAPQVLAAHGLEVRLPEGLELGAANTFPAASGIASSASSFAAVTWSVAASLVESFDEFQKAWSDSISLKRALASISRKGSGSSCRSMEGPFVRWEGEAAWRVDGVQLPEMTDLVLLAGKEEKEVSSSDAHKRVLSSPLWQGRVERVAHRLEQVQSALRNGDFMALSNTVWEESWEMHSLFHTSKPPFTYWLPRSLELLRFLMKPESAVGLAPPVVTMDAGPNVHLLVPTAEAQEWRSRIQIAFPGLEVLEDRCGSGAHGWQEQV
jgi:diphosphomevalonate decarboxylase